MTSRRALVGLPGAQPLALGVLAEREALALLTAVAGRPRVEADPQSAREVVALCGSLPLAIRIAGTRLAAEPAWKVADLARQLADETARLDVLADAEHGVRASIALSLRGASPEGAEVFRLIGLFEGDELDLKVAARLVDRAEAEVEPLLEHLVDLHLLESPSPRRYQFHDLVRAYAREIPTTADEQAAARDRVFALYVAMAWQSRVRFGFTGVSRELFDERWVAGVEELEYDEVMLWLDAEAAEVLAAARRMMASLRPDRAAVVRLAMGMFMFWVVRHRQAEGAQLDELALAALRDEPTCAPPVATAVISYSAGSHYTAISGLETAASHLRVAIEVDTVLGEESHLSFSMVALAHCLERLGRLDEAMELARAGLERGQRFADQMMEGEARLMLGVLAGRMGRFAEQDASFELAVPLMRSRPGFVDLLSSAIGESYLQSGRIETARKWLQEHLDGVRASGNKPAVAEHLRHLATAEVGLEAYDAARVHLEEALELSGTGEVEAWVRHQLGRALSGLGETEPAREQWRLALELYRRYGLPEASELLELVDDGEDRQEAEG